MQPLHDVYEHHNSLENFVDIISTSFRKKFLPYITNAHRGVTKQGWSGFARENLQVLLKIDGVHSGATEHPHVLAVGRRISVSLVVPNTTTGDSQRLAQLRTHVHVRNYTIPAKNTVMTLLGAYVAIRHV